MQDTLGIKVYGPALAGEDRRPVAVVRALEGALPGLRLEWTVSDDHQLRALPQRDAWLARAQRNGGFPLVCNNDEGYPVTVFGLELPARAGPGNQALFEVHAELPLDPAVLAAAVDLLEAVSEGAGALWGHATPFRASAEIAGQTIHPHTPEEPPRGLPALKLPEKLRSPEIPHRLGWLNYWSADAARAIGFPDASRDAELLLHSRRTATGGWIVQLTHAPLDLDNAAHLDAILRTYERFPAIGGRG
jgi:hypothetical protein